MYIMLDTRIAVILAFSAGINNVFISFYITVDFVVGLHECDV